MNRTEALELDKSGGTLYVAEDEESGMFCVFGTESGFAYSSHADPRDAEEQAMEMRDTILFNEEAS